VYSKVSRIDDPESHVFEALTNRGPKLDRGIVARERLKR